MHLITTQLIQSDMMAKSVLMAILFWGSCVIGTFQFKYVNGERSAGKSHLPQKQSTHSPLYVPVHAPSSHIAYHSSYLSLNKNLNLVPASLSSPSPSPYVKSRRTNKPSASPYLFLPMVESVPPVASTMATEQTNSPNHEIQHLKVLIIAAIISVLFLIGVILLFAYCTWVHKHNSKPLYSPSQAQAYEKQLHIDGSDANKGISLGPLINRLSSFRITKRREFASAIDYLTLQEATNNFSSSNYLGKGGFGCVYKAQFHDGFCAAVKKLNDDRQQAEEEFQTEVDLMSRVRHPNLVSLLGFCAHGTKRLLVYELMRNGSLEDQLHGPSRGSTLTWQLRLKIALDVARALEHLHEHCDPSIIHCDLKSSNVLLDASYNAKLSDFGLAITVRGVVDRKFFQVLGTLGYVAPEYLLDGKLTEKSDVYAFGVVLLELITGRKPVDKSMPEGCQSLVTWAKPQLTDRTKLPTIVDPVIKEMLNLKHLQQVAAIAVLCVQPEPDYRPLIADVVHSLIPLVPLEHGGALRNADTPQL
ncbi:probable receptor-like protein kinase At1g80640 isoform X2 [Cryptomeria japonica]|uniref:probable receptor-like protein kinase At1g80640 isoform X2 n=1 Tax=Cryptomeria japonica TaxID=3369 RepID=UPI0025AC281C|nr:probable receptor-like protein kinase At1g80640 isoform X2 [Cryptomeria japonica]